MLALTRFTSWINSQPWLLLILAPLFWGGNAVASKWAVGHISPMALVSLRWIVTCSALVVVLRKEMNGQAHILKAHWRYIAAMGALGYTAFNALLYAAAHRTSAVNLTILQGAIPVLVLAGGWLILSTPIRPAQTAGLIITALGVLVTATHGDITTLAALEFNAGDGFMLLACLLYAGYTLGLKYRPPVSGITFFMGLAMAAFISSLPLLAAEIVTGAIIWPTTLSGVLVVLYVGLFPSLASQVFFMRGVELVGPARAGLFVNLVPVFGALLAVLLLDERFGWHHALALMLVMSGIALAEFRR